ncbi:retrovirus-related pol polyprotein from transposon TNT 1-94 [Tanacetum coccineum]
MTENRRVFTSYKAYDGGHVVFGSNLKGKVIGGGNITHDSITITNVEHVSGLAFNLISIGQLCDDDFVVSFTKVDCTISKNGKMLAKGHRRNDLYTCKLGDNSKQQICLTSVVDSLMLWHKRLGRVNMRESSEFDKLQFGSFCEQHGMSYNLLGPFTSQSSEIVERTHHKLRKMSRTMLDEQFILQKFWCHDIDTVTYIFNRVYIRNFIDKTPYEILRNRKPSLEYFRVFGCKVFILNTKVHLTKFDPRSYEGVFLGYSQTSKAYIVLNKEIVRIEESLNVIFNESLPKPKSSSSVEDDRINEPIVQDLNVLSSLQVNVLDKGYPKTSRVLELLHLDLFGPSQIQSYGVNFYTLMLVDDHSNYTWVVFVESKDDVLDKFKILCKRLKNLHDCSIVSIVTNHYCEFDKLQFGSFCEQHGMSYNLTGPFTSQSIHLTKFDPKSYEGVFLGYSQTTKAYIVLNKETMRIEESLNVTFNESLPKPKSSSSIEDNRINEPIVQDLNGLPSLQVNVLGEGYPKGLKEARDYLIE